MQHLPHRPGHPGATLVHVIGCTPSDQTLTREQALTALHQPRATACRECAAASSLTDRQEIPPGTDEDLNSSPPRTHTKKNPPVDRHQNRTTW
ncbi:DUF6233 domain-containing protein [Streptomyces chryseus]